MNSYYHIIEQVDTYTIGCHGYYEDLQEAEEEKQRLQDLFENSFFYVFMSADPSEPPITTV